MSVFGVAIVEGPTERNFIRQLLAPHLAHFKVYLTPIVLSKPGQKGGDVRFSRMEQDLILHARQKQNSFITTMVDYYGIKGDWPGYHTAKKEWRHEKKAEILNNETLKALVNNYPSLGFDTRFIPYVSMYETEALLFSDASILARELNVPLKSVQTILQKVNNPEEINDGLETAPSKRLAKLIGTNFGKNTQGITIAQKIGIEIMKEKCPLFCAWVEQLERLK